MPYEPESSADSIRYWRKQARDESGRTVVARTLENSYVQVCVASMFCNDKYPHALASRLTPLRPAGMATFQRAIGAEEHTDGQKCQAHA